METYQDLEKLICQSEVNGVVQFTWRSITFNNYQTLMGAFYWVGWVVPGNIILYIYHRPDRSNSPFRLTMNVLGYRDIEVKMGPLDECFTSLEQEMTKSLNAMQDDFKRRLTLNNKTCNILFPQPQGFLE